MAQEMAELSRKEREFARRERDILDAAISLFNSPDWRQVTVAEIAKKADVGKGTVYKHFESKEEIYAHIAYEFQSQMTNILRNLDSSQPFDSVMRSLIRQSFDLFIRFPAQARVYMHHKHSEISEQLSPECRISCIASKNQQEHEELIFSIIECGIEQGAIPERPVRHIMVGMSATFDGVLNMIWDGNVAEDFELSQEELVTLITQYMVSGIKGL